MESEYKGRYYEVKSLYEKLERELNNWKIAFGWTLAGLILGLFIAILT